MTKLIWRNLWRNGRRTSITVASIVFAVLFSILMQSYKIGVFNNLIKNVVGYYTGYIQIHKKGYWDEQVIDNCFELKKVLLRKLKKYLMWRKLFQELRVLFLYQKVQLQKDVC